MQSIMIKQYPVLSEILWDYQGENIPADEAFKIYETRWGFIDQANMQVKEKSLLKKLIKEYGNGCFLPTEIS